MEQTVQYRTDDLVKQEREFELRYMDPHDAHYWQKCGALWNVYQKGFDDFAGPKRFRHSVNYDTYHRAGLIALLNAAAAEHHKRLSALLEAVNEAMPYFYEDKKTGIKEAIDKIATAAEKAKERFAA